MMQPVSRRRSAFFRCGRGRLLLLLLLLACGRLGLALGLLCGLIDDLDMDVEGFFDAARA